MKKIIFNETFNFTEYVLNEDIKQFRRIVVNDSILSEFQKYYYDNTFDYLENIDLIEAYYTNYPEKLPFKVNEIVAIAQTYKSIDDFYNAAFDYKHSYHGQTICKYDVITNKIYYKWKKNLNEYKASKGWTNKKYIDPKLMLNFLQIQNIKIEKLQDISDNDCLLSGVKMQRFSTGEIKYYYSKSKFFNTPKEAFKDMFNKLYRKDIWNQNPYVLVYNFECIN